MDIRLKTDFPDHDKTDDLVGLIGECAVRCLLRLWCWAAENRPKGLLYDKSDLEIERKARWNGPPNAFVAACLRVRFMVRTGEGILLLHDWDEHQIWIIHAPERKAKARLAAEERWKKQLSLDATSIAHSITTGIAQSEFSIARGNAPSPSPSPSPININMNINEKKKDLKENKSTSARSAIAILEFPVVGRKKGPFDLTKELFEEYKASFPDVDILAECRSARAWCISNPKKQKTLTGMPRFLCSWLSRAQNQGNSNGKQQFRPVQSAAYSAPGYRDEVAAKCADTISAESFLSARNGNRPKENSTIPI